MSTALAVTVLSLIAAPPQSVEMVLQNHRFHPDHLVVPAGSKIALHIRNADDTVEEIESYALNREQKVGPTRTVTLYVGPLTPGLYDLYGEDHPDTAQATIEVQ
jgi:heme/copper-type cytochrome/quinol oxidase subunit 2